jgi:hypothetical protein
VKIKEANIGDVIVSQGRQWRIREYRYNLTNEELYEASQNGFRIGYLHFARNGYSGPQETMIYMGPVRTKVMIGGLYKHHLFLTATGTFALEGYEFRRLSRIEI